MAARRIASSLVLGAAAFASIATSQVQHPSWYLDDSAPIVDTVVPADPTPTVFAITAEARGPRRSYRDGDLTVTLEVRPSPDRPSPDLDPSFVTVTLKSETDPSLVVQQPLTVYGFNSPQSISLALPAWETCEAGPCFDDYRLEIETTSSLASVLVSGNVVVAQNGIDETAPSDAGVIVTVTPLGAGAD